MRWNLVLLATGLLITAMATAANASEAISFGFGIGTEEVDSYRFEVQKGLGFRWLESETGFLSLSVDGAVDYLSGDGDDAIAASIAPLLTYQFNTDAPVIPFVEAGVGGAYISETRIGDQNLGIHFQFEDIIGIGLRLGERKKHGFRVRALHYSNADLDDNNSGLTFFTLSYHYRF